MVLAAWIGAFARAVSAHDWLTFRALDPTTLVTLSGQAGRYQGDLLPVLFAWAALLLLTPAGYTTAFRAAVLMAGTLGYLHLSPHSFFVTGRVTWISHWLIRSDGHYYGIAFVLLSIAAAYVLQSSAINVFGRLNNLRNKPGRQPRRRSSSGDPARMLGATLLILVVLLSVIWAATVIRLSASGASTPTTETSYGARAGSYQAEYLFVLIFIAVCVSAFTRGRYSPIVAVVLTALYGLAPNILALPTALEITPVRAQFTRIGTAWGADSLWAALFIFIPVVILGIYFVRGLLSSD
jgi:hypothetical protein